jgi:uncharacterized protein (TIGR02611 family)
MKRVKKAARRLIIGLFGFPILLIGIILIPLPGPGLLVCFLGLLILSLEFEWAATHRDKAKAQIKKISDIAKDRGEKIENRKEKQN